MSENGVINKLREMRRLLEPEQRFAVNVKDAREVFKLMAKSELRRVRVGRKHWYRIYDGDCHVADLFVSMTNAIENAMMIAFTVPNTPLYRTRYDGKPE